MNGAIIDYLNKQYGYELKADYYSYIYEWRDWWKGYFKPFHKYNFNTGKKVLSRDMFTMKMAKKVCEDWASLLLNEKTSIVVDDPNSNKFLQGEKETDGVFGENDFWVQANRLIEKACYSGTGAVVLRLDGIRVSSNDTLIKTPEAKIKLAYISAENIIPISWDNDKITEVAFCSEFTKSGKDYIYLEVHRINESGNYEITNKYFNANKRGIKEVPLPPNVAEVIQTNSSQPLFAVFKPNLVNFIDNNAGFGISVFASAIDNLKGVDLAFNNFCNDFKLGGKKVFLNRSLVELSEDGREITPDDVNQQLFTYVGNSEIDGNMFEEHNPDLRVQENTDGIQAQLDYLSFKVGFGTKHYQFNAGSIVTATQYTGDKQELLQNATKQYIVVENMLISLVKAILYVGKEFLGADVNPEAEITVQFDDSIVIDKEAERARDLQEMRDGIMQKWEYRMKWYGEDEKTAKAMVAEQSDNSLMGFGDE